MMMTERPVIFDYQKSSIAPVVAAGVITGVTSLVSTIFGGKKKTTAPSPAELQLAQQQLEAQKIRDKQNVQIIQIAVLAAVSIILMILIFKSKR
jgi:formate hydrogenlyase subunit 3/multisubunit Na+/H+ antiporter MnhD subunit